MNFNFEHEAPDVEQEEIDFYIIRGRLFGEEEWEEVEVDIGVNQYTWSNLGTNQFNEFQIFGYGFLDEQLMESDILEIETRQLFL